MMDIFNHLLAGQTLSQTQAEDVFSRLLKGELNDAQTGALLALIAIRSPTVDELVGAARVLRTFATPIALDGIHAPVIDTCGTGGAPKLFNVSTIGAIVTAAAAGGRVLVAKHGNRSRTGRGSAELLEALGVNIHASPQVQRRCLEEVGICFSFAPNHHPAAKHAAGVRKSLDFPTIFNLLGPLANPAGVRRQLVGTYSPENASKLANALARLGAESAIVVTSVDGLDELTTTAENLVFAVRDGTVTSNRLDARSFGFAPATIGELQADSLLDAVKIAQEILDGQSGPRRDLVLLNAGVSLHVGGAADSVQHGAALAAEAIDSGAAGRCLGAFVRLSCSTD